MSSFSGDHLFVNMLRPWLLWNTQPSVSSFLTPGDTRLCLCVFGWEARTFSSRASWMCLWEFISEKLNVVHSTHEEAGYAHSFVFMGLTERGVRSLFFFHYHLRDSSQLLHEHIEHAHNDAFMSDSVLAWFWESSLWMEHVRISRELNACCVMRSQWETLFMLEPLLRDESWSPISHVLLLDMIDRGDCRQSMEVIWWRVLSLSELLLYFF